MPIFSVVDMDANTISAAYPLVRAAAPGVSAEQWLEYAQLARIGGGLLGLVGPRGDLFGFLTYRSEENLRLGKILAVDNLVTFELHRAAPGRQALCEGAEALARQQGCKAIEFRQSSRGYALEPSAKAGGWLDGGHSLKAVVFSKMLEGTNGANNRAPF